MTITAGDAVRVMRHVAAVHHRTAPRLDDPEAVAATAAIWARMFNRHNLTLNQLLAAVEQRGESEPVAPEPSEIIDVARKMRAAVADSEMTNPAIRAAREGAIDAKVQRAIGPLVEKFGSINRPTTRVITTSRPSRRDPDAMAAARAELDAIRGPAPRI